MLDKKILFFVKTSYWSDYQSNSHGNAAYATLVCPILLFLTLCYWRQSRCDYETDGSYSASRTCPYISTDIVKLYTYNSYTAVIRILIKLLWCLYYSYKTGTEPQRVDGSMVLKRFCIRSYRATIEAGSVF